MISHRYGYAALKNDGTVFSWGHSHEYNGWKVENDELHFVKEMQFYGISNIDDQFAPVLLPLSNSTESKFKSGLKKMDNIFRNFKGKNLLHKNNDIKLF